MHATTYGLDVAKRVFQMYWVDGDTGEIVNRRFGRDDLIQYTTTVRKPATFEHGSHFPFRKLQIDGLDNDQSWRHDAAARRWELPSYSKRQPLTIRN